MQLAIFCHSLMSDWNHGNAHFLRGITTELLSRGHQVRVLEPHDAWSLKNLLAEHGETPLKRFRATYPQLKSIRYNLKTLDLDEALDGVDLVLVHEWNDHQLVARLGRHRHRNRTYRLLLHDTHHRALTDRESMVRFDLRHFDGVLAFGQVIRDLYLKEGWTKRAWTWHEAADTRIFRPFPRQKREGDLIWIGNWGDEERTAELFEFLLKPSRELKLKVKVHGVRYPEDALTRLARAGIEYGGWLPNYEVPLAFARHKVTVHIPRRPYVLSLPGIPTIRPFEALACGIPLICSPWEDTEGLFRPGVDYLVARNGREMKRLLRDVLHDEAMARELAANGRHRVLERHTCAHRVNELLEIYAELEEYHHQKAALA